METRFNGNVVPFASNSTAGERTIFGDWNTESDDINDNLNDDFKLGWEAGLEGTLNPYPPSQYFNGSLFTITKLIAYLYQQGIAEWNATQEYKTNSITVGSNGNIYKSTVDNNIGNNPTTDSINWNIAFDSSLFVKLTDAQTIAGIKTFSSFPITPSSVPTNNYQVANKKYVDDSFYIEIKIIPYGAVPSGLLECDGSALSRTTYSRLFSLLGETYGAGDGSTTFNLPDLRGEFIRGFDNSRGVDNGRTLGSSQSDGIKTSTLTNIGGRYNVSIASSGEFSHTDAMTGYAPGGSGGGASLITLGSANETRPRNIAMMYCIKY